MPERHALFQPANHAPDVRAAVGALLRGLGQRDPKLLLALLEGELASGAWPDRKQPRPHHPNHGVAVVIKRDALAEKIWISAESPLPHALADQRDSLFAGLALFRQKCSPQRGMRIQHLEI